MVPALSGTAYVVMEALALQNGLATALPQLTASR